MPILPWKVLNSRELHKTKITRFRVDECELGNGKIMPAYYVLEFPDWVNIVPVNSHGEIILIRQYRHALAELTIEVPGGSIDKSDQSPIAAAKRELQEETGYTSENWQSLVKYAPNPAMQNNFMHTFLALDCKLSDPQNLDPYEEIEVFAASLSEVRTMLKNGEINHSIVAASLYCALEHLK